MIIGQRHSNNSMQESKRPRRSKSVTFILPGGKADSEVTSDLATETMRRSFKDISRETDEVIETVSYTLMVVVHPYN